MKKFSLLLCLCALLACQKSTDNTSIQPTPGSGINTNIEFPQFSSIEDLLMTREEFREEDCTFQLLQNPENELEIQVSNRVDESYNEKMITDQVKRNIVFVAFQVFARTDIEEFNISSVPLISEPGVVPCQYLEQFRITTPVKRKTAIKILDIYFFSSRFQHLYQYNKSANHWQPNENFSFLQYEALNDVFGKLAQ